MSPDIASCVGKPFVSVHDGRLARLAVDLHGEAGLSYMMEHKDRGAVRFEPVTPARLWLDWRLEGPPAARALLDEEVSMIAKIADHCLSAIEKNEPFRFWDRAAIASEPDHDPGLVRVIGDYLRGRQ